jgi:hypothetical protein
MHGSVGVGSIRPSRQIPVCHLDSGVRRNLLDFRLRRKLTCTRLSASLKNTANPSKTSRTWKQRRKKRNSRSQPISYCAPLFRRRDEVNRANRRLNTRVLRRRFGIRFSSVTDAWCVRNRLRINSRTRISRDVDVDGNLGMVNGCVHGHAGTAPTLAAAIKFRIPVDARPVSAGWTCRSCPEPTIPNAAGFTLSESHAHIEERLGSGCEIDCAARSEVTPLP